jgi:hypothetical protein
VRSGLKVLDAMLEEDRSAICGPRYAHVAERRASRAGTVNSEVVLGGRKVAVRRPRVRAERPGGGLADLPGASCFCTTSGRVCRARPSLTSTSRSKADGEDCTTTRARGDGRSRSARSSARQTLLTS